MVKVYDKNGKHVMNEPPYTEAEEMDLYRRVGGGPVAILHAPKAAASPQSPPPPNVKPRRSRYIGD